MRFLLLHHFTECVVVGVVTGEIQLHAGIQAFIRLPWAQVVFDIVQMWEGLLACICWDKHAATLTRCIVLKVAGSLRVVVFSYLPTYVALPVLPADERGFLVQNSKWYILKPTYLTPSVQQLPAQNLQWRCVPGAHTWMSYDFEQIGMSAKVRKTWFEWHQ